MPANSALLHIVPACELCDGPVSRETGLLLDNGICQRWLCAGCAEFAGPTLTDDEELDLWIYDNDPELYDGFVSPDAPRPEPGPDDPF